MSGTITMRGTGEWPTRAGGGPRSTTGRDSLRDRPVLAGVSLAALAVAEATTRAAIGDTTVLATVVVGLLALVTTLPLSFGSATGAAFIATAGTVLSLALFETMTVAGFVGQVAVMYRFGRNGPARQHVPTMALLVGPFLLLALFAARPTSSEAALLTLLLAVSVPASLFAGMAARARREAAQHSTARQAIAGDLLDHNARGERARIARELHDVVAHHISMVAVQAETARLTTPGMPEAGAQRLSAIGDTARAALTEMRRLLGVLREDAQMDVADRRPQPGLAQLNDLLDESRDAAGTATRLILSGLPVTVDPGVGLAAYRIAQEALTNARRHAPGAAVDVELHYAADELRLRIRDNGPGPAARESVGGHGLSGMRERAVAVGGALSTGSAPGGGFVIEALLPVDAKSAG